MEEPRYYMHIERITSDEVEGILDREVEIFTKLDGTNAGIYLDGDKVVAHSRHRLLTVDNDNAGFCKYVEDTAKYRQYLLKHKSHHLYGEWLVKHTIKTYTDNSWHNLYIFDVYDEEACRFLTYDEYKPLLEEFGILYIPRIAKLNKPTEEEIVEYMPKSNFLQELETTCGEGLVIKAVDYKNKYGRTVFAKIINTEFKVRKGKGNGKKNESINNVEEYIVDNYCTIPFIEKELSKVLNDIGADNWNNKYISRCLNSVYHELVAENSWDFVKKLKNPTIHFGMLYVLVMEKTKSTMKTFFAENGITLPF